MSLEIYSGTARFPCYSTALIVTIVAAIAYNCT